MSRIRAFLYKLRVVLGWWRADLIEWREHRLAPPTPVVGRQGKLVDFSSGHGSIQGYPTYVCYSRRGGFVIGHIEYRNQWGYYAFYIDRTDVTPLNREILAEIYAMLKELRS